ncbi:hypothetical protein FAES_2715 [Fibrella aestuarina BUZ 2]|uniref:Uncharacterized protein n=2 Tax=Fibrella TaxID=861914 RepID=I0K9C1_9BACT|nr:hypothetical protein FAES_2715 [Fibrella aestuarina BUZ 2]
MIAGLTMYRPILLLFFSLLLMAPAWGQVKRPSRTKRPQNPYRRAYQKGEFTLPPTDSTSPRVPFVHFPFPLTKGISRATLGVTFTTTPRDITEEVQLSVPAGDLVVLHGLTDNLALTGRFTFQFLQNNASAGLRYSFPIKGRFYGSIGAEAGAWFGSLQLAQFNNRGFGIQGRPTAAIGFRSSRDLLVTLRGELDMSFFYRSRVGQTVSERGRVLYNGAGATITLEQAFFGRRHVALGFRALYTDFNWQFWSLYSTFDRAIFYPEAFIGFFL